MIETIIKRDGRIENFDSNKIKNGLFKSVRAAGGNDKEKSDKIAEEVIKKLNEKYLEEKEIRSDQILDIVEEILIKKGHDRVAREFILHRYRGNMFRKPEETNKDNVLIKEYLDKTDWRVRENSNMSYNLSALNFNISSKVTANYWLTELYTPEIAKAHIDGDIHIHDLGMLAAYCCGFSLEDLLISGFGHVHGKISCSPAKHFRTALGQMVNFLFTLQNEVAGAVSFSNFDTLLAPFVKIDNLSRREVKQGLQEFIYNMNVSTRTGGQTPFSNLTLDLVVPSNKKNLPCIVGGTNMDFTYGDCQEEMNLINDCFFEVMLEGDSKGRPFTFPIPTINITKNFDWNNKTLNNLWKVTSKFGLPYFSNMVNSNLKPEDIRSMCCRLKILTNELPRRDGGLFASAPLTGSLGVCTINCARLGYLYKDEKDFFDHFEKLLDLAKESLIIKRKYIDKWTENGLYPYLKFYLRSIKEQTGSFWSNHFLTLGLLGVNECLLNMGKGDITTEEGIKFSEKILDFMLEKSQKYQQETGSLFNVEAVPGESCNYRFAKEDRKRFSNIIFANDNKVKREGSAPYYTGSTLVPVDKKINLFEMIKKQESLQNKYSGGTVIHVFIGEANVDPEAVKSLVKKISENYTIPYFSITPSFSICKNCGFLSGIHHFCPNCSDED